MSIFLEVVYQYSRPDQKTEEWAHRDVRGTLEQVLSQDRLSPVERAATLDILVTNEVLEGDTGASLADLDAWSLEAVTISPTPAHHISRGGVLLSLGRAEEARLLLQAIVDSPEDKLNTSARQIILGYALRKLGDEDGAQHWINQGRMIVSNTNKATLATQIATLEAFVTGRKILPVILPAREPIFGTSEQGVLISR